MSHQTDIKRITAPEIARRKGGEPIVVLTAYHAQSARLLDPHVDILMVGDSLGMVMHGLETTVPVPLDLMIAHAQAVMRASERALVVVDMPFGSYEASHEKAFENAARLMAETGCGAGTAQPRLVHACRQGRRGSQRLGGVLSAPPPRR